MSGPVIFENSIDIVIPVFNSRIGLENLLKRLSEFSKSTTYKISVYFVDDGSKDGSFEFLKSVETPFSSKLIQLERNYGQHAATAVGLSHCKSIYCVTLDDDLQHNPFDIIALINEMKLSSADLVYGTYQEKKHNLVRNIGSWMIKKVMYKDRIEYSEVTSFRLMQITIANKFKTSHQAVNFIDEILLNNARKVGSVRVQHNPSLELKSRYSSFQLLSFALKIVLFNSSLPLKLILRMGLLLAFCFFVIGIYFIYNRIINDVPLGFSAIIVSIFFISGIVLIVLGIIAEYLRKIWEHQQGREHIVINEIFENNQSC